MTTIAATLDMMAADSKVVVGDTSYSSTKLYSFDGGRTVIGGCGDVEAIDRFVMWWPLRDSRRLRIARRLDFEAVVLTSEGLWRFGHLGLPEYIKDGVIAIGTGEEQALAAMDTMRLLGRKVDPRIAVKVACLRNNMTGEPVEFLRVKR